MTAVVGMAASLEDRLRAQEIESTTSDFHGFVCHNFKFPDGVGAKLVEPRTAAAGNPWIWRARFWGHQPGLDKALLEKGFHVAYCDVSNLFGGPDAVDRWNDFYGLSQQLGLSRKPVLEGMSRGGLIIFNWAKANPDKVSAIYGDNPVCDIHSWPGKGRGALYQTALLRNRTTEEGRDEYRGNPFDGLEALARKRVPVFLVVGDADKVVPIKENALVLKERYEALGGPVRIWIKPGMDHHPHGLEPVDPLLAAILEATAEADEAQDAP